MKSPIPLNHQNWNFPHREKPQYLHIIVGAGVTILSCYLVLLSFRPFLAEATTQLLSIGGIEIQKSNLEPPSLILKLANDLDLPCLNMATHRIIFHHHFLVIICLSSFPVRRLTLAKNFLARIWRRCRFGVEFYSNLHRSLVCLPSRSRRTRSNRASYQSLS